MYGGYERDKVQLIARYLECEGDPRESDHRAGRDSGQISEVLIHLSFKCYIEYELNRANRGTVDISSGRSIQTDRYAID